jgi:UDP-glucose 4-epimerase
MRVCITGGAGFIGSWVSEVLVGRGHEVLCVDDFSKSVPSYVGHLHNGFRCEKLSILDDRFAPAVKTFAPHSVIHLAAVHFIPDVNARPREAIRINVEGTQAACMAARACGAKHLLVASSPAVYAPASTPHEETEFCEPVDLYGLTKLWTEHLAKLSVKSGIPHGTGLRLFNAFGPRETNPHLIPQILENIGTSVVPLGNVTTLRDYTYVEDIATAIARLLEKPQETPWEVYNICHGQGASALDVLNALGAALGTKLRYKVAADRVRKVDIPILMGSTAKLKAAISYVPPTGLVEGLRKILAQDPRYSLQASGFGTESHRKRVAVIGNARAQGS